MEKTEANAYDSKPPTPNPPAEFPVSHFLFSHAVSEEEKKKRKRKENINKKEKRQRLENPTNTFSKHKPAKKITPTDRTRRRRKPE